MLARLEDNHRVALGAILVVALILRLGALAIESGYEPVFDSADYDRHARSIAAGDGYPQTVIAENGPSAFRPPLYPYMLGGVYLIAGDEAGLDAGRALGALLGVLAVACVYAIGGLIWGVRVGLLAASLAAIFPPLVLAHLALVSEPLFLALMLSMVVCTLLARREGGNWRWALAAGALCGLAAMTRSNGALLAIPAAIGVWTALPRFSLASLAAPAAVVLATVLVVVPWTVRNAGAFDAFVPTNTQTGYGISGAFNDDARDRAGYTATWVLPEATERYRDLFDRADLDERELDSELRSRALSYAGENPGFVVEATLLNFARSFSALGQEPEATLADRAQLGLGERTAPIVKWNVRVLDVLALVALIVISLRAPGALRPWFVWTFPALAVLAAVWVLGSTRYALPAYPFMLLLLAVATAVFARWPLEAELRPGGRDIIS
ncbi:MAG: glycosyltransferase family 39 protein [Solirubrobacterales bacterium]